MRKTEHTGDRPCDHEFFVSGDHSYFDPTGIGRNEGRILRVAAPIQFYTEKLQPIADPLPDHWRIFTDASRKYEGVQPTERG